MSKGPTEAGPPVFQLNMDILNVKMKKSKDSGIIGKICKRIEQASTKLPEENEIPLEHHEQGSISTKNPYELKCFIPFIRTLMIRDGDLSILSNDFDALEELHFRSGKLRSIDSAVNALSKVKTLKFVDPEFNGDIYDSFLQFSPNLKRLYMMDNDPLGTKGKPIIGNSNKWLENENKYKDLEHFELISRRRNDVVIKFLQDH